MITTRRRPSSLTAAPLRSRRFLLVEDIIPLSSSLCDTGKRYRHALRCAAAVDGGRQLRLRLAPQQTVHRCCGSRCEAAAGSSKQHDRRSSIPPVRVSAGWKPPALPPPLAWDGGSGGSRADRVPDGAAEGEDGEQEEKRDDAGRESGQAGESGAGEGTSRAPSAGVSMLEQLGAILAHERARLAERRQKMLVLLAMGSPERRARASARVDDSLARSGAAAPLAGLEAEVAAEHERLQQLGLL
eukprot:PLAT5669.1.p1 GENE.PLAT5669.1~~PLAT5669.1.p1  ORF type:complete len:243 (+),score=96.15 PLAT5669.1:3-731(+)